MKEEALLGFPLSSNPFHICITNMLVCDRLLKPGAIVVQDDIHSGSSLLLGSSIHLTDELQNWRKRAK